MKNSLETTQDGFWRFYASTEKSHREPQQNGLIDWEAAGNEETHQDDWRIQLMDASLDNTQKSTGKKKIPNIYMCSVNDLKCASLLSIWTNDHFDAA